MPFPPSQSRDVNEQGLQFYGDNPQRSKDGSFSLSSVPSASGLGTRQGSLSNQRPAVTRRKLIHWLVPEGPMVQMYINPQNISITDEKDISTQRTKGGFVLQYWGEKLIEVSISGTTGTSGIEGINVLRDVYRNEQLAFDPYALALAAKNRQDSMVGDIFGLGSLTEVGNAFADGDIDSLFGIAEESNIQAAKKPPTLASLAFTVEMYWSGEVYRGFFKRFLVKESVGRLGLFDYDMSFTATQRRGLRRNFLGWHRSAVNGPSNSDPEFGTPYSYSSLVRDVPGNPV